jgi:DNA-binding MarR family transcriptional regulator/GNAT superfamily N-acetyltransferase
VDDPAAVAAFRRFNRTVTQRVGALHDHFLSRRRALGEARVLWEIGDDGCELRVLRARLDLDSGYLSRILRALEADGLVTVGPSANDKRVREVRLTRAGKRERKLLDHRSDELASALLAPLDGEQRAELVRAMRSVERLLTTALVEVQPRDPLEPDAQYCLREYATELDRRFPTGWDPTRSISADAPELLPPVGVLLVASLRGAPIGCGALKFHDGAPTEVKRMWVAPSARGLGVGRRLLRELEQYAAERGTRVLHLETNGSLAEAIAMYRSDGYVEVEPFNDEPYAHHWFEKHLTR